MVEDFGDEEGAGGAYRGIYAKGGGTEGVADVKGAEDTISKVDVGSGSKGGSSGTKSPRRWGW